MSVPAEAQFTHVLSEFVGVSATQLRDVALLTGLLCETRVRG